MKAVTTDDETRSQRLLPLVDILLVFLLAWVFVVARAITGSEFIGTAGKVVVMGLAIWLVWRRGGGWQKIGMARPKSIPKTVLQGIGLLVLALAIVGGLQTILMNLLGNGADLSRFDAVRRNVPLLLLWLVAIWTAVTFGEEIVWRAFLMERLATLLGTVPYRGMLTVVISAVMFGLSHYYQGAMGMILSGVLGLIYATVYLWTRRNLWVLIIAHGLTDSLSFIQLYRGEL